MIRKLLLLSFTISFFSILAFAQEKDSLAANPKAKVTNTAATNTKPAKPKEVKKIDDPLLQLSSILINKIQHMKPNELLLLNERSVRNERRVDESGEEFEVTVTVRLGFSQDMITGIVKEVPLYQSADREMNLINVKIPVKFCCTTKIDSVHTKKHCGKMSELNDFEDNEHCKDWIQDWGSTSDPDAVVGYRPKVNKKGVATKPTIADSTGFGKPVPKTKPSKKDLKNQKQEVASDSSDVEKQTPMKPKKEATKKEKSKTEPAKKQENKDAEEFGKPSPKPKGKDKNKKEKIESDSTNQQ